MAVEEVEEELLWKGVVALGVFGQELLVGPQGVLELLPGRPAPPLVKDVVAQRIFGAGGQVPVGQGRVAVPPVLLLQQSGGHAGVEERPGRTGWQAQNPLRLL